MKEESDLMKTEQKKLVEDNINLVKGIIGGSIFPNENITGLGYEDLLQEGCLALCKASWSYSKKEIPFSAYARRVIRNALIDYCRSIERRHAREGPIDFDTLDESLMTDTTDGFILETVDFTMEDAENLLSEVKEEYTGGLKKGVDALRLKMLGFSGKEIAALYGTSPQLIGAWVSKAARKLRVDPMVLWKLKSKREDNKL